MRWVNFIRRFFQQETPRSRTEMPGYYRNALKVAEALLACYFLCVFVLAGLLEGSWMAVPLLLGAGMVLCRVCMSRMGRLVNNILFSLLLILWTWWYITTFSWGVGGQLFLVVLIMFRFFNVYESPRSKVISLLFVIAFRMGLYFMMLNTTAARVPGDTTLIVMQIVSTLVFYAILAACFILFSSSIQDTERELRLHNQELHKEAGTDPLTGLQNRRAMLDEIELFRKKNPEVPFGVAIADIDFFKKVNDTYGHACGDYVLKELSSLFTRMAGTDYTTCRWGGEEFCFFMPGKNVDEAGRLMFDLNAAVEELPLHYEGTDLAVTITIGVEENDFRSPLEAIMDSADRKLYMGKAQGRNQVVV